MQSIRYWLTEQSMRSGRSRASTVRDLRIRWIGHTLHAEADVSVDPTISLAAAHELAHHAEDHLITLVPRLTAATIHVSPTGAHT
jgi:divalent metal cation (Fe/Co/Zn/Cd) transporter